MPQALKKTTKVPKGFHAIEVRSETLDVEDRTVEVIWSTGAKVKRYSWEEGYFMEELSMDPKAIRLDRFVAGMSLLDSHEAYTMDSRLGTVVPGSVRIENGKAYAKVKFSRKQKAEEILQDLRDGHAVQISVGYKIHTYEKSTGEEGQLPTYRAIDWEPLELSCVAIPADPGAYSRSEGGEAFDCVVVSQEDTAPSAAPTTEKAMNKRDAAKKYTGDQLDILALGAGLSRSDNETDEALRARLLAAYDAEDEQQRAAAEEAARRQAADAETRRLATEQQNQQTRGTPAPTGISQQQAADIAAQAVAAERARTEQIRSLAAGARIDDEAFVAGHISGNTTVEAFRSALLDKLVERQSQAPTFPHADHGLRDADTTRRSLVANAILHRHGIESTLMEGANEWRDMSALDTAKELLRARGEKTHGSPNDIIKRALHTTSDFPVILNEVTNRTLMAGYAGYENTFEMISNRNVVSDFREVRTLDVGDGPDLKKVNEHGEFTRGTLKENEEGFKIATYGRVFGLTRQMLINDQLGAFTRIIRDWGQKAAELEGDVVWAVIVENAKLKDGVAMFHSSRGNLAGTASYLTQAALESARLAYRKQKKLDGKPINIAPKYLFVGSELEIAAQKLITGVTVPTTTANVVPEAIRSLQPVYEYRLDAVGQYAWFLFADQSQTNGRGIQHAYLSGQESPFFDERVGFDVDGIEYKIRHDFGAGVNDYRYAYKNAGAAPA